jgi:predicted small integral membrane protein
MSVPDYMVQRKDRPVGISILSVLHFIGGIGAIAMAAFFLVMLQKPQFAEKFSAIGIPVPLLVAAIVFLGVLGLASSVGMWRGARWGWYLGSFYYAYSILLNVNALLSIGNLFRSFPPDEHANMTHSPSFQYTKFAVRLLISTLIYLYFFKDNVREYFGLHDSKRWIAVAIQFFLCIDIALAIAAWYKYSR